MAFKGNSPNHAARADHDFIISVFGNEPFSSVKLALRDRKTEARHDGKLKGKKLVFGRAYKAPRLPKPFPELFKSHADLLPTSGRQNWFEIVIIVVRSRTVTFIELPQAGQLVFGEKFSTSPVPLLALEAKIVVGGMVVAIIALNQWNQFFGDCFKLPNALLKLNEASVHNYGF